MNIEHQFFHTNYFFPTWDVNILFLGTFNPSCGRELDYYYQRQSNGFWKILKHFDTREEYTFSNFQDLKSFMINKRFGCVDVIKNVIFPDRDIDKICGRGYTDNNLFRVNGYIREYTFEGIKEFATTNSIRNIFTTWGCRDSPKEFRDLIYDFKSFCINNEVQLIHLPSPSGRIYRGKNINLINRIWWDILNPFFNNLDTNNRM